MTFIFFFLLCLSCLSFSWLLKFVVYCLSFVLENFQHYEVYLRLHVFSSWDFSDNVRLFELSQAVRCSVLSLLPLFFSVFQFG